MTHPACEACLTVYHRRRATRPNLTYQEVVDSRAKVGQCSPKQQCGDVHALLERRGGERTCRCGRLSQHTRSYDPEPIIKAVGAIYGVSYGDITGPSQEMRQSEARHAACYLMRRHTRLTLQSIAMLVGRSDHSTVIHAVKATKARMGQYAECARLMTRIEQKLSGS